MADHAEVVCLEDVHVHDAAGNPVLAGVDLTLAAGAFAVVVGRTGAGKTLLLRLLGLLCRPQNGSVALFGTDAYAGSHEERQTLRRRIGLDLDELLWIDGLSVEDHLAMPLRLHGASSRQIARFVPDLLGWLELDNCARAVPSRLSVGQRRLLRLARAVITRPDLILADEPLSGLDPASAGRAWRLLRQLNDLGCTVVMTTTQSDLHREPNTTTLRLDDGRLTNGVASAALRA